MSQEQSAQSGRSFKTFEQKSDNVLKISLGVGFAVLAALATTQWVSKASAANAKAKPAVSVQAKSDSSDSVFRCADGRVSFTPCS